MHSCNDEYFCLSIVNKFAFYDTVIQLNIANSALRKPIQRPKEIEKKTLTAKRVAYWTEISHLLTIMASSWSVYTVGASMKAVAPVPSDWTGNTDEAVPDDAVVAKWPLASPAEWPGPNTAAAGNI